MKINILSIGKFKKNNCYQELFNEYRKRTKWDINLKELIVKKKAVGETLKELEAKTLLNNISNNSKIIVLDERGKNITTSEFADIFFKYETNNVEAVDFIIGGATGLTETIRQKADFVLSFGKMVFPHLMVRIMLIEQIYRVFTIKSGHPYHK
jgi:23S rRNA (pseudouridine1915-N3)-methyltransferase